MTEDEPPIVVYRVALNSHPLTTTNTERTDEELIAQVERRTTVEGMDFPEWVVRRSDPTDRQLVRYANTDSRINVKARRGAVDHFEEIAQRLTIRGFDVDNAAMSNPPPTPIEDFDGTVHLDLTDE